MSWRNRSDCIGTESECIDTAGIRQTEDLVEKMGVDKAKEYAQKADLIIYVMDASKNWMK